MKKSSEPNSAVWRVLRDHNLGDDARLYGELVAAIVIDAIEHPDQMQELATFVNSELAAAMRELAAARLKQQRRRKKKETIDV